MRPLLDSLTPSAPISYAELAEACATSLSLSETEAGPRIAWDGIPVVEARVRAAATDLEVAGLVERTTDGVALTASGASARGGLPPAIDVAVLSERFPAYASHREERARRRGA